jgi:hypothetical protein
MCAAIVRLLQHPLTVQAPTRRTRQAYVALLIAWLVLSALDFMTTSVVFAQPRSRSTVARQFLALILTRDGAVSNGMECLVAKRVY